MSGLSALCVPQRNRCYVALWWLAVERCPSRTCTRGDAYKIGLDNRWCQQRVGECRRRCGGAIHTYVPPGARPGLRLAQVAVIGGGLSSRREPTHAGDARGLSRRGRPSKRRVGWRAGGVGWHWAGHVMALGRPLYGTGPAAVWHWAGRCMALGRPLYGTGPAAVWNWAGRCPGGLADGWRGQCSSR